MSYDLSDQRKVRTRVEDYYNYYLNTITVIWIFLFWSLNNDWDWQQEGSNWLVGNFVVIWKEKCKSGCGLYRGRCSNIILGGIVDDSLVQRSSLVYLNCKVYVCYSWTLLQNISSFVSSIQSNSVLDTKVSRKERLAFSFPNNACTLLFCSVMNFTCYLGAEMEIFLGVISLMIVLNLMKCPILRRLAAALKRLWLQTWWFWSTWQKVWTP